MTKPSSPAVPCRALPLIGDLAAKAYRGEKWQTRRPISAVNSLVDGLPDPKRFARLWLEGAWIDQGPSPAGNSGPYLKATDPEVDTTHRIYSRVQVGDQFWIREPTVIVSVDYERFGGVYRKLIVAQYDDGTRSPHVRWPERLTWQPVVGHKIPNGCICEAARTVVTVTGARPERVQSITEEDSMAEGVVPEPVLSRHGGIRSHYKAFKAVIQELYPGLWDRNGWIWCWTWEPHKA